MEIEIKKMKLSELVPTEKNPRKISKEDLERLKSSVKSFPKMLDIREIVIDENCRILGGHQRVKALIANGEKETTVKVVSGLTEAEKDEFTIRDNVQNGEWDMDILANEWDDLPLDDWGIELPVADIEEEIVEDEAPEPPAEPKSKLGEIYQLGEHRLMCGDSTDAEQVAVLMGGKKADIVFTDPPYGMNLNTDFSSMKSEIFKGGIGGKRYEQGIVDDFDPQMVSVIFDSFDYVDEVFMWGADYYAQYIPKRNDGSWFVWDKRSNNNDDVEADESSDKQYGSCFELCWSKKHHKRELARVKWAGIFGMHGEDSKRFHPTQKPVALSQWFLRKFSKDGGGSCRFIWRFRLDTYCLRATWAQMLYDGTRPALCRCHH